MLKQSQEYSRNPLHLQVQKITVVAITWNLFGSLPPTNSLLSLSKSAIFNPAPDIIFFGSQECERSLSMALCCESKDQWQDMLKECFSQYHLCTSHVMTGLHSAILIKNKYVKNYEIEERSKLKAGTCNLLGNKGAISIQMVIFGQRFQFINCHLAAHQGQSNKRNETVNRILNTFVRKDLKCQVIFLGDLNYRIEMTKKQYQDMLQKHPNTEAEMKYTTFLDRDQLRNQPDLKEQFLQMFQEGNITFPPTYKIGVFSKEYNKERIPGWTDRIFHRRSQRMTRIQYHCEYDIEGSDHRPVLAKYQKKIDEKAYESHTEHFVPVTTSKCQLI